MKWLLNKQPSTEIPYSEGFAGFVYIIHFKDGTQYIGKKTARSLRSIPATKKAKHDCERISKIIMRDEDGKVITSKDGIRKARARGVKGKIEEFDVKFVESKWQNYEGSSEFRDGREVLFKEILAWCQTTKALTYVEASILFTTGALFNPNILNANILGKFFDNVLEGENFDENFYKITEEGQAGQDH